MELRLDTGKLALFAALTVGGIHFTRGQSEESGPSPELAAALEALEAARAERAAAPAPIAQEIAAEAHEAVQPDAEERAAEEPSARASLAEAGTQASAASSRKDAAALALEDDAVVQQERGADAHEAAGPDELMARLEAMMDSADDFDSDEWEALFAEMGEAGAFGAQDFGAGGFGAEGFSARGLDDYAALNAQATAQWAALLQQAAQSGWQNQGAMQNHGWANSLLGSGTWDGRWNSGNSPADPWLNGGIFTSNSLTGTAVSSSGGSGYIALGNGDFVSW